MFIHIIKFEKIYTVRLVINGNNIKKMSQKKIIEINENMKKIVHRHGNNQKKETYSKQKINNETHTKNRKMRSKKYNKTKSLFSLFGFMFKTQCLYHIETSHFEINPKSNKTQNESKKHSKTNEKYT